MNVMFGEIALSKRHCDGLSFTSVADCANPVTFKHGLISGEKNLIEASIARSTSDYELQAFLGFPVAAITKWFVRRETTSAKGDAVADFIKRTIR
jgi:hypothetical protein